MPRAVVAGTIFAVLLAALIAYAMIGIRGATCDVCIEFRGETACRTAEGKTREDATRTATDTACAVLASGMADSIACSNTLPKSAVCR